MFLATRTTIKRTKKIAFLPNVQPFPHTRLSDWPEQRNKQMTSPTGKVT